MEKISYLTPVAEEEAGRTGWDPGTADKLLLEKKAAIADNELLNN